MRDTAETPTKAHLVRGVANTTGRWASIEPTTWFAAVLGPGRGGGQDTRRHHLVRTGRGRKTPALQRARRLSSPQHLHPACRGVSGSGTPFRWSPHYHVPQERCGEDGASGAIILRAGWAIPRPDSAASWSSMRRLGGPGW